MRAPPMTKRRPECETLYCDHLYNALSVKRFIVTISTAVYCEGFGNTIKIYGNVFLYCFHGTYPSMTPTVGLLAIGAVCGD